MIIMSTDRSAATSISKTDSPFNPLQSLSIPLQTPFKRPSNALQSPSNTLCSIPHTPIGQRPKRPSLGLGPGRRPSLFAGPLQRCRNE